MVYCVRRWRSWFSVFWPGQNGPGQASQPKMTDGQIQIRFDCAVFLIFLFVLRHAKYIELPLECRVAINKSL